MLFCAIWELARSGPLAFKRGAAAKARSSWGERLWLILSTWTTLSSTSIPRGRTLGFERWGFRPISWSRALRCPTRRRGPAAPLLSYSRSLLSVHDSGTARPVVQIGLHLDYDGPQFPVRRLMSEIAQAVEPRVFITTGTGGGVGANVNNAFARARPRSSADIQFSLRQSLM